MAAVEGPYNPFVNPLLNDLYQITMSYAYWKSGRCNEPATFELFFRKCPFHGEYVIFAGLDQVIRHIRTFKFTDSDIEYLQNLPNLSHCDPEFFEYLRGLDCSEMKISALAEGTIVFPRVTMIKVEGPLAVGQLLETTLLNLVNFPSLVATNAARMRLAAGPDKQLFEFGLRRAQGPDGALTASRYSYVGGFDGTSNVMAGKLTGVQISGTHAHAFVQSYTGFCDIKDPTLDGKDFAARVLAFREAWPEASNSNTSELAAFVGYALCFPTAFLALVDTYDTLQSGVINFIIVACVLEEFGYKAKGIRLDSGDLAYLSKMCKSKMLTAATKFNCAALKDAIIVASNDINEEVLISLTNQGHVIDAFGIGTKLVTCASHPALGCVYKLVEIHGQARIKLSQDLEKVMIPGNKAIYRLYSKDGLPLLDLVASNTEPPPEVGKPVLCRHPFHESKRANVTPSKVVPLLQVVWDGPNGISVEPQSLDEARNYAKAQVASVRSDITRPLNPTPYKVSVTQELYTFLHSLWLEEMPVSELS